MLVSMVNQFGPKGAWKKYPPQFEKKGRKAGQTMNETNLHLFMQNFPHRADDLHSLIDQSLRTFYTNKLTFIFP